MNWLWFMIFSTCLHQIYSHEVLNVDTKKCTNVVSGGFLSMTVDPFTLASAVPLKGNALEMVKSLSPSFVRICGKGTEYLHFGDAIFSKNATITATEIDSLMNFIQNANLDLILGLNIKERKNGEWDYENSEKLINYMAEKGYLSSFQLGENMHNLNGHQIGKDVLKLKEILDKHPIYQQSFILGPDFRNQDALIMKDFLSQSGDTTSFSVISKQFHKNDNVEKELKNLKENLKKSVWNTRDVFGRMTPLKPIALADKESSDGSFEEAKMLAKKLGSAAKLKYEMILRKPGRTCLINPTPEYWFALLYKSLIGRKVFDAKLSTGNDKIHVYSHCASNVVKENLKINGNYYTKGSLAIFGVNENQEQFELKIDAKPGENIHIYALTEMIIGDKKYTLLNGEPLEIKNGIPGLKPKIEQNSKITIPGDSIFFIIRPDAHLDSCPYVPFIAARASITRIYDIPELFSKTKREIKLLNITEVEEKYKNLAKNFYSRFFNDMSLVPDKKDDLSVYYVTYTDNGWFDKLINKAKKENTVDVSIKRPKRSLEQNQEDETEKVIENEEEKAIDEEIKHEKEQQDNEEAENKEQEENIDRALLQIAEEDTKNNTTKPENIEDIKNEGKNQDLIMEDVLTPLEEDKDSNCMPEEKIEQDPEENSPLIMAASTHIQKINVPYQHKPMYKTHDVLTYQNQGIPNYKNPEVPTHQNQDVLTYQNQEIPTSKNPEIPTYQNQDVPMYQNQDIPAYKNPEVLTYQNQDAPNYKNPEVPMYLNQDIPTYKNPEVLTYQNQDAPTYKNSEVPMYQNQDVPTYQNQEIPIYKNEEIPPYKYQEIPMYKNEEIPYKYQDVPTYKKQDSEKNQDLSEKKENIINKILSRIVSKEDAEYANKRVDPSKEGTVEEMESPMVEVVLPETNDKLYMPLKNAEFENTPRYLDNGDDLVLPTENQPTTKVQREISLYERPLFNRAQTILEESPGNKITDYFKRVLPKKVVQPPMIEKENPRLKTIEEIKQFLEQQREGFEQIKTLTAELLDGALERLKNLDGEHIKVEKKDLKKLLQDLSESLKLNIPSLAETASRLRAKRDIRDIDIDEYEKHAKKFVNENMDRLKDSVLSFKDRIFGKRNKRSSLVPNSVKYILNKKIPEDDLDISSRVSENDEISNQEKSKKPKDEIGECKESGQTKENEKAHTISMMSRLQKEATNFMQELTKQFSIILDTFKPTISYNNNKPS